MPGDKRTVYARIADCRELLRDIPAYEKARLITEALEEDDAARRWVLHWVMAWANVVPAATPGEREPT